MGYSAILYITLVAVVLRARGQGRASQVSGHVEAWQEQARSCLAEVDLAS